ncbi:unnamed protein product [Chrysoparadoxa australica]
MKLVTAAVDDVQSPSKAKLPADEGAAVAPMSGDTMTAVTTLSPQCTGTGCCTSVNPSSTLLLGARTRCGRALPRDSITHALTYLVSKELGALSCLSKSIHDESTPLLAHAVAALIKHRYGRNVPSLREDNKSWERTLATLRYAEMQRISELLALPEARPGKGFFISKTWSTNFRRFEESQARRLKASMSPGKTESRKTRRRERTESNIMPPWPLINADITCKHGALALSSQTRAKRVAVEKRVWRELRHFYPGGNSFSVRQGECIQCTEEVRKRKKAQQQQLDERQEEISLTVLKNLFSRKTGVPPALVRTNEQKQDSSNRVFLSMLPAAQLNLSLFFSPSLTPVTIPSVLSGIYHLIPRCWLQSWRKYVRGGAAPRHLSTALLLCEGHGRLLVPPHVEDYLVGANASLLKGLEPDRSGCICEIVTPEEWDALTLIYPEDLCVRFCVQPEDGSVAWGLSECKECFRAYIGQCYHTSNTRKGSF